MKVRELDEWLLLKSFPGPARNAKTDRHIIGGSLIAGHRCGGRPREIIVQDLSQNGVAGYSNIGQSQVETSNRSLIHLIVLSVAAVYLDYGGFVTVGIGIRSRATESLGPISGKSLDMFGVETMAERMGHDIVCHHPTMPGSSQSPHASRSADRFENSLHALMMINQHADSQ